VAEDDVSAPKPADSTPTRTIEAPLSSYVVGGTVSSHYETELKKKRANAEARRAEEAARAQATALDPEGAKLSTMSLGGRRHPSVVLEIRNSDGKAEEFIMCEITAGRSDDPNELVLVMCCPLCAPKVGSDEAQFHFSNKHKRFFLDTRTQGELWVNPKDPSEFVTLAGKIFLEETVRCPGLGCNFRFKIDNSVIRRV
jgi:hypothetical protein